MNDHFKWQLRELFQSEFEHSREIRLKKDELVYASGINDSTIYYVESGRVKELLLTLEGDVITLSTHRAGDIFGEQGLCGSETRRDMAIAVEDTTIRKMPSRAFLDTMRREDLLEGLVQYLAERLSERQQSIRSRQSDPDVPGLGHVPFEFTSAMITGSLR